MGLLGSQPSLQRSRGKALAAGACSTCCLLVGGLEASEHFGAFLLLRNVHPALSIHSSMSIHTLHAPGLLMGVLVRNPKSSVMMVCCSHASSQESLMINAW